MVAMGSRRAGPMALTSAGEGSPRTRARRASGGPTPGRWRPARVEGTAGRGAGEGRAGVWMQPGAGREHGQPPPQEHPQRQPHGAGQSRNARPSYRRCSACQAKNRMEMTGHAFSDNAVRYRRLLAIVQAHALNTRVHLRSAAPDGHREAQRPRAGLTGLRFEASSGACWSVATTLGAQVACRASCSLWDQRRMSATGAGKR
jgi:hypothetical protein